MILITRENVDPLSTVRLLICFEVKRWKKKVVIYWTLFGFTKNSIVLLWTFSCRDPILSQKFRQINCFYWIIDLTKNAIFYNCTNLSGQFDFTKFLQFPLPAQRGFKKVRQPIRNLGDCNQLNHYPLLGFESNLSFDDFPRLEFVYIFSVISNF